MQNSVNYNNIAFIYDGLCQFVFGQRLKNAQMESLSFISAYFHVLIVGGGTGWILEELTKQHASGLRITYIDNSSRMIALSKKRKTAFNTIEFINESIENSLLPHEQYDVILTPFLFDNFSQSTSELIFKKLDNSLKPKGKWLYVDFCISNKSNYRQQFLLKLMYVFFRVTCNIKANQLPDLKDYFSSYEMIHNKYYSNNFIITQVFQKS
jgi:ubiquinone/menaquinone biosynthesis C-methylase UbiE